MLNTVKRVEKFIVQALVLFLLLTIVIGRLAGKGGYTRFTDRFEMPRLGGSSE